MVRARQDGPYKSPFLPPIQLTIHGRTRRRAKLCPMGRNLWAIPLTMGLLSTGCSLLPTNETSLATSPQTTAAPAVADSGSTVASVQETTPPSTRPVICGDPGLVSPVVFDEAAGTYPAFVLGYVEGLPEFDVVQWLTGPEAAAIWAERFPDNSDGPPNDYLIENQNPKRRTAPVAADAAVALLRSEGGPDLMNSSPGGFEDYVEVGDHFGPPLVWLTFENGVIVSICEQYRP